MARELGVGLCQLEPERRRLGMNPVAAADAQSVLVLSCTAFENGEQGIEVGQENIGGSRQLNREARVEHIGRGKPLMHEARLRSDVLGDVGEEGDDVVFHVALDGVDALDLETSALGDGGCNASRNRAKRLLRFAGVALDVEPDAKARLRRPDGRHVGP